MSFTLLPTFLKQEIYNAAKDWKHMGHFIPAECMCVYMFTCVHCTICLSRSPKWIPQHTGLVYRLGSGYGLFFVARGV